MAFDKQRELPLVLPGDASNAGNRSESKSVHSLLLIELVLSRDNLSRVLKQVRRDKSVPRIGGITVDALPNYLRKPWLEKRSFLGFAISRCGARLEVAAKGVTRLKFHVRRHGCRPCGHTALTR